VLVTKTAVSLTALLAISALATPAHAQQLVTVSNKSDGSTPNGDADFYGALGTSANGRYVLFQSYASDLVPGDTNDRADVFVRDLQTNTITLASIGNNGERVHLEESHHLAVQGKAISADGRYVLFETMSPLVPEDTNRCAFDTDDGDVPAGCADIYQRDLVANQTMLISKAGDGHVGNGNSGSASMSADGRFILFSSESTNLTPGGGGLFLRDRDASTVRRIDLPHVGPNDGSLGNARLSGDGRSILYTYSYGSDLGPRLCGAAIGCSVSAVADATTGVATPVNIPLPDSFSFGFTLEPVGISNDGRYVLLWRNVFGNSAPTTHDEFIYVDRQQSRVVYLPTKNSTSLAAALSADGRTVLYSIGIALAPPRYALRVYDDRSHQSYQVIGAPTIPDSAFLSEATLSPDGSRVVFLSIGNLDGSPVMPFTKVYTFVLDADGDQMPDGWETQFALNPADPNDAASDFDGDGKTSLQEFQAGTHPNGQFTRYLAEGSTNGVFSTRIAIFNPGSVTATAMVRFLGPNGAAAPSQFLAIRGHERITVGPDPFGIGDFSTVVESTQMLVVDRTMTVQGVGHGAQGETSTVAPSMTWYFAEGATGGPFSLYYLLQNPGSTDAHVTVQYLREGATPISKSYIVGAATRMTIWVDQEDPGLESTNVSAKITSDQPIVAERSLYLASLGQPLGAFEGGVGATAPATRWFLAEGATGTFFDLYVLLANPETTDANITLTYLLTDGTHFSKSYLVPAQSRRTVLVDEEDPRLQDAAVSVIAESTNAIPFVCERAMWWPQGNWYEGHLSLGATTTARKWALAEGEVGGAQEAQTYVLIANTSNTAGTATVNVWLEGNPVAPVATTVVDLHANSRTNVPVASLFQVVGNPRVAVTVESTNADLVVERAIYWNVGGVIWAAGTAALGTPLP
jgi:hypothetical protein